MVNNYSASVIRGGKAYIFFNGRTEDGEGVIKVMKVTERSAPVESLRIGEAYVPASDGPIGAAIVSNDTNGIRLYIVNKKTIVEYGLDTPVGVEDDWKREGFTSGIKLDQNSFLNVLGKDELGSINVDGKPAKLRLYYTREGAGSQVTQQTFTDKWIEKTISN